MNRFIKVTLTAFVVLSIVFLLTFLNALAKFSQAIGQPNNYFIKTVYQAAKESPYQNKDKINFIILGQDKRDDLLEKTEATDTIILASLNLKNYKVNIIPLPRDLWSYDLEAKINDIYPQSLESQDKFNFIKENFQKVTNQPIDHVLVINTDNLIDFVSIIGGVDLYLEKGFVDKEYPNPDHIASPEDSSIPVYKTIEFPTGWIHLDNSNITEFVRSRKGAETAIQGGTDIGRIERQQLLIKTIFDKLRTDTSFLTRESQLVDLYKFWNEDIIKDLTDVSFFQILVQVNEDIEKISLNEIELPIGENATSGVIYHPNWFINRQWVFIPSTKDYLELQEFIEESIE